MDTLFAVLHVVGAVFIVGPMAILPMTAMRALRSGQLAQVATLAKSTTIFTYLSLVVIVLGFGLVGMADPRYELSLTTPWVLASIVLSLAAVVLNLALVVPAMKRAAAGTASGTATDAVASSTVAVAGAPTASPGRSGYAVISAGSGVVSLLLLAVVVLMVWKP
ncbi:DUF2269 domain-containing protein [Herbiconiux moechotypicola]|uniref:DUF2269 family protein n=1 Tax=Herbiconiux moechotypicola TaxID=637393 RepID=A0ABN3DDV1_9MICO|nr:DUF2269 domain-containing protein [Herbiconiux moechotypicola]MCS5729184.1 DUF2269 domain-containing protein [Herbiconiux moechotypicola]